MDKNKLNSILQSMEGLTYLEWNKLKFCIDKRFNVEISERNNKVPLTDIAEIVNLYKHYDSTI